MKRKKCRTAGRRKKKIGIFTSLAIILCAGMAFGYITFARGERAFLPPVRETSVKEGLPETVKNYQELPVREGYMVGIDTSPVFRDGRLYLNAVNKEGNTVWFLVRLYQKNKQIGETGILHPGEYVESIACKKTLVSEEEVLVQIVAYEPDTYHSEGVAKIACKVVTE